MRIRTIKPEFWQHKMHKKISESAALLAVATLSYADDEGRFEVDFDRIKALLFTYRKTAVPLEEAFAELRQIEWVTVYPAKLSDGENGEVAQITNFRRHQVINKAQKSYLPAPPKKTDPHTANGAIPDGSGSDTGTGHDHDGSATGGRKEGMIFRKEGGSTRALATLSEDSDAHIPSLQEVIDFGQRGAGIPKEFCQHYHNQKETKRTWLNGRGELIHWQREITGWWAKDRASWVKKRAGEKGEVAEELSSVLAELQWQKDPARLAELRKRKKELEGGA